MTLSLNALYDLLMTEWFCRTYTLRGNFVLKLMPNFGDGYGIIKDQHVHVVIQVRHHYQVLEINKGGRLRDHSPSLTHMHTLCTCSFDDILFLEGMDLETSRNFIL